MIGRFFNSYFRFSYDDAQVRSLPSKTARPILGKSTWMMRSTTDVQCYGMKIMIAGEFYCWLRTGEFSRWNFGDIMFLWEFLFLAGKFKTLSFLAVAWPNPPKFHLYARESVTDRREVPPVITEEGTGQ